MRKHNRTVNNREYPYVPARPAAARDHCRAPHDPTEERLFLSKGDFARRGTHAHRCTRACARIGERRGGWRDCDTHARKHMLWPLTYPVMLNRVRPRVPPRLPQGDAPRPLRIL
jgi:hypothetical protein